MTNKGKLVFNDYMSLSDDDRKELRAQIQTYETKDWSIQRQERGKFNEEVKRIVGPTSGGFCPSCGRG